MRNNRCLELPFSLFKLLVMSWLCITLCLQLGAFLYVKEPSSGASQSLATGRTGLLTLTPHSPWRSAAADQRTRKSILNDPSSSEQGEDTTGFAYATVITNCSLAEPAMVLAQNLRLAGGKADFVLISTPPGCNLDKRLSPHFTSIVMASLVDNRYNSKGFNKLLAWRLTNYSKVLYLDVDVMPLVSLDHLFAAPTPAMVPDVYAATKFNSGVMLLEPSEVVFTDMMDQLEHLPSYNGGDQGFLNSYFSDWYSLPARHRLAAGYNAVLFFPDHYHPPAWFHLDSPKSFFGPIKLVHFANPWSKPWGRESEPRPQVARRTGASNIWCSAWQRTKQLLQANNWKPLPPAAAAAVEFPDKALQGFTTQQRNGGRLVAPHSRTVHPPVPLWEYSVRDAFVTVATCAEDVVAAGVLAHSYNLHHSNSQNARELHLLVASSVAKEVWAPFKKLFKKVRVIEPIDASGKGKDEVRALSVLQVWNQTRFDKLVYIDPYSLMMDNCAGLLEYRAFAATPSLLPPDCFSSRVMVVQPHRTTFEDMVQRVREFNCSLGDPQACVDEFLNLYYADWYSKPALHRISLSYAVDGWFKQGLMSYLSPWRSLAFDRRAVPWGHAIREDRVRDRVESAIAWVDAFCALTYNQRYAIPKLGDRLCPKKKGGQQ